MMAVQLRGKELEMLAKEASSGQREEGSDKIIQLTQENSERVIKLSNDNFELKTKLNG